MEIERQIYQVVFGLCVGSLLLIVLPVYAIRYAGKNKMPPLPKGLVPVQGFGLIDVVGIMLFVLFYAPQVFHQSGEIKLSSSFLVVALIFQFALAAFVVGLLFWRINVLRLWGVRWSRWYVVFLALPTVFVMWSFMAVLEQVGYNAWIAELIGGDPTQEIVKAIREETDEGVLILMALVTVVGAPLSEEIIFRGYIYPATKKLSGISFATLFSGALFAVVHANLGAILPLFVLGMVLALLYEVTGSLWMPIAVHFTFNLGTMVVQQAIRLYPEWFEEAEKTATLWFS